MFREVQKKKKSDKSLIKSIITSNKNYCVQTEFIYKWRFLMRQNIAITLKSSRTFLKEVAEKLHRWP